MQWIFVTVVHFLQALLRQNVTLIDSVFISYVEGIYNSVIFNTRTVSIQCTHLGFWVM